MTKLTKGWACLRLGNAAPSYLAVGVVERKHHGEIVDLVGPLKALEQERIQRCCSLPGVCFDMAPVWSGVYQNRELGKAYEGRRRGVYLTEIQKY